MAQHHVQILVSRGNFARNIGYLRHLVAPAKLCVVMKANAYGHGLEALAPVAVEAGADMIGICTNPEAETIRRLGLKIPLVRLRMALETEMEESVSGLDIQEQVGSKETADWLSAAGIRRGRPIDVHLDIDTGMGRSGFFPEQVDLIRNVMRMPGLRIAGMMTHFPAADSSDLSQTEAQIERMERLCVELGVPADALLHTHNSAATVRLSSRSRAMVRAGAACYGVRTSSEFDNPAELKPVMSFHTWVAQVRHVPCGRTIGYGGLFTTTRDSRIASLPVGFGEGYPRALFNKGIVLIHGKRCPVVGRVSLNVLTIDVTDLDAEVRPGDEVVLIGSQGNEEITFEEMAEKFASVHTEINLMAGSLNTISYT
ncbi:MAG TPA: alanine racemase [Bryobacteraceae bacterium]|nr:alanine racemase [Bryobacteraceae bacterium]